ncbi:RagB/SusD family nutrient uptake outer membrane protein [Pedobacter antarcticus]|uniref:RagB/SusD family nutrient uptake outer membrane protein n=1 Tax=Pedobacter antarcticus TaxID=34086 RepID=UPI001C5814C6|nr:RagB/SusD family nutrient uptake outer membrane protein [Pedobacter antarcticus]
MKTINPHKYLLALLVSGMITGCNPLHIDKIEDPNNPSISSVMKDASPAQIQYLVTGLESKHRDYVSNVTNAWGSLGREIWLLNSSDSRNMTEWLGLGGFVQSANIFGFGITGGGSYASPYAAIKQAQIVLDATANTSKLNSEQKNAVNGFAHTISAYQFMIPANWLYQNGIRIDVKDETSPGPFVSYEEALTHIKSLLDAGYEELNNSGSALPYKLSAGFSGFDTPDGLRKVNRAVAARLALYRKDWNGALTAVSASFLNVNGDLNIGPKHTYAGGTDATNPLFSAWNIGNPGTLRAVSPSTIRDATPGDQRVTDKFLKLNTPFTVTTSSVTLTGEYQDKRYPSNTLSVPFIRNEELILIKAEAEAQLDQTQNAVNSINIIRNAAKIGSYGGATDKTSLLKEILYQRRYSLWAEPWGHRWIDVRRYTGSGLLFSKMSDEIDTSFDKGTVYTQFPLPQTEVNWELYKK